MKRLMSDEIERDEFPLPPIPPPLTGQLLRQISCPEDLRTWVLPRSNGYQLLKTVGRGSYGIKYYEQSRRYLKYYCYKLMFCKI